MNIRGLSTLTQGHWNMSDVFEPEKVIKTYDKTFQSHTCQESVWKARQSAISSVIPLGSHTSLGMVRMGNCVMEPLPHSKRGFSTELVPPVEEVCPLNLGASTGSHAPATYLKQIQSKLPLCDRLFLYIFVMPMSTYCAKIDWRCSWRPMAHP